jgi:capsular exopolysaccharide synthesis family protein
MSNFFETLQKAELIAPGELALPLTSPPRVEASESRVVTDVPVSFRSAKLKLSVASPAFPFDADPVAADQYRIIRTKILHDRLKPRVVVVSSGGPGDGKTINSINIASCFALKPDLRIALIDGDMRRPQVANTLGISDTPGLSDVLTGQVGFEDAAVSPEEAPNLCILPSGSRHGAHAELLDSDRWRMLVTTLRQRFHYVIIDAPPIATIADYELIQLAADGVVLVARPDHSERNSCLKAIAAVPKEKLIGIVLNCVQHWLLWRSAPYSYYSCAEPPRPKK